MNNRKNTVWIVLAAVCFLCAAGVIVSFRYNQPPSVQTSTAVLRKELDKYAASEHLDRNHFFIDSIKERPHSIIFDVSHPGPPRHSLIIEIAHNRIIEFHRMIENETPTN